MCFPVWPFSENELEEPPRVVKPAPEPRAVKWIYVHVSDIVSLNCCSPTHHLACSCSFHTASPSSDADELEPRIVPIFLTEDGQRIDKNPLRSFPLAPSHFYS